ncbi:MAG: YkgJ family cysteine cluster protein [Kofleriaceae bacterium]
MQDARARYAELVAKVDAFFDRVHQSHAAAMACASGCARCCEVELSITGIEAEVVDEAVAALPAPTRARLAARAAAPPGPRCAALDDDDRCAIYAARPLVCRSHGLPIRGRDPRGLPVVEACALNFTGAGPAAVPAADVLDQTTLSTVLYALDAAHAAAAGRPAATRKPLRSRLR